jgi:hypothetical protein
VVRNYQIGALDRSRRDVHFVNLIQAIREIPFEIRIRHIDLD